MANFKDKIIDLDTAIKQVNKWKTSGKKVVFTNGCFDIIHRGHVEYLYKASLLGDKLILGLNTDSSVRKIKGKNRPINNQESRAVVLAAFEFIDAIVFFSEDTPYNLIKDLIPNVLTKGADYKPEDIVGYDIVTQNNGCVETIDFVEGFSTTSTINKMKND